MNSQPIDQVLAQLGAKLEGWQVRALFLGAQASTNLGLGPQHLFDHIFGREGALGDSIEDANENLQALMSLWNGLVTDHHTGRVRLSRVELGNEPSVSKLEAFAKRRHEEITWFTRGIDAGGDDPMEFGTEGEELLRKLAEAAAFLVAYQDLLGRTPAPSPEDLAKTRKSFVDLTSVIEAMMDDLMTVSDDVRQRAVAEYQAMAGRRTDDGVQVQRPVKIGRNESCPCGSGRKWKRCCGAPPNSVQ